MKVSYYNIDQFGTKLWNTEIESKKQPKQQEQER